VLHIARAAVDLDGNRYRRGNTNGLCALSIAAIPPRRSAGFSAGCLADGHLKHFGTEIVSACKPL